MYWNATVLSVQQTTECALNPYECGGYGGCNGAAEPVAFQYMEYYGVTTDEAYPQEYPPVKCKYNHVDRKPVAFIRGHEQLPSNDYDAIINHIANVGPLAAYMQVKSSLFQYHGGIYSDCSYDEDIMLNHVVQIIGYGTDPNDGDYWLIKNSWGDKKWGIHGYLKLAKEKEVLCGESLGHMCPGDEVAVSKACGMCGILFETFYPVGASSTRSG